MTEEENPRSRTKTRLWRRGHNLSHMGLAPDGVGYESPDSRRSSQPYGTLEGRRNGAALSPGAEPRADHCRRPQRRGRRRLKNMTPVELDMGLDLALAVLVVL